MHSYYMLHARRENWTYLVVMNLSKTFTHEISNGRYVLSVLDGRRI